MGEDFIKDKDPEPKQYMYAEKPNFPCPFCYSTFFTKKEPIGQIAKAGFEVAQEVYICTKCKNAISQETVDKYFK